MSRAIQITQKSGEWETSELHPGLRWQFSVNTGVTDSNGLSCGYLQIAAGAELPLHFHNEQEIYIITKGNAELLAAENSTRSVRAGDTVTYQKIVGTASAIRAAKTLSLSGFSRLIAGRKYAMFSQTLI